MKVNADRNSSLVFLELFAGFSIPNAKPRNPSNWDDLPKPFVSWPTDFTKGFVVLVNESLQEGD